MKICLVDDTPDLLDNLTQFLEMEGYEIWAYKGGAEALQRMKTDFPDLIITDLWMPGMDGIELIKEVRLIPQLKIVPIAIFSAKPFQEYEAKVRSAGNVAYIKKPATLEEIISVINDLIQKE